MPTALPESTPENTVAHVAPEGDASEVTHRLASVGLAQATPIRVAEPDLIAAKRSPWRVG